MSTTQSPWITEDLEMFQDAIRRFVERELAPHEERWCKQQHVDREVWHKAGAIGLLCPSIPEEYGGGGSFAHDAIVALEQTREAFEEQGMENIELAVEAGVATVTLARPERKNALSEGMQAELAEVLERLRRDPQVRTLLLAGKGGAFCAGGDTSSIGKAGERDGGPPTRDSARVGAEP